MPYPVAVTIMANAPTHDLGSQKKNDAREVDGDITGVYDVISGLPATLQGSDYVPVEIISNLRMLVIFVEDVPDEVPLSVLKNLISEYSNYSVGIGTDVMPEAQFDELMGKGGNDERYQNAAEVSRVNGDVAFQANIMETVNTRNFNFDIGSLNPPTRNQLLTDKYITMTASKFVSGCFNKKEPRNLDLLLDL